jgi:Flp pilus assembly protein TadG
VVTPVVSSATSGRRPHRPPHRRGAQPAAPSGAGGRRGGGDQGSSALELVLLTPTLIALVFGLVQAALVWNAQHTVGAAAQQGARLARAATATLPSLASTASFPEASSEQVRTSTLRYLRQTGGGTLADPTVTIRRTGDYVTVTVSGTTVGVLPGTTVRVSGSSRTPLEGFRP